MSFPFFRGGNLLRDHTTCPGHLAVDRKVGARAQGFCFLVTSMLFPGATHKPHTWESAFLKEHSLGLLARTRRESELAQKRHHTLNCLLRKHRPHASTFAHGIQGGCKKPGRRRELVSVVYTDEMKTRLFAPPAMLILVELKLVVRHLN